MYRRSTQMDTKRLEVWSQTRLIEYLSSSSTPESRPTIPLWDLVANHVRQGLSNQNHGLINTISWVSSHDQVSESRRKYNIITQALVVGDLGINYKQVTFSIMISHMYQGCETLQLNIPNANGWTMLYTLKGWQNTIIHYECSLTMFSVSIIRDYRIVSLEVILTSASLLNPRHPKLKDPW